MTAYDLAREVADELEEAEGWYLQKRAIEILEKAFEKAIAKATTAERAQWMASPMYPVPENRV